MKGHYPFKEGKFKGVQQSSTTHFWVVFGWTIHAFWRALYKHPRWIVLDPQN